MRITSIILVLTMLLIGCSVGEVKKPYSERQPENPGVGDVMDRAVAVADSVVQEEGYDLQRLERRISQDSTFFLISYVLKDPRPLGGGAVITISREDLRIVRKVFEQ